MIEVQFPYQFDELSIILNVWAQFEPCEEPKLFGAPEDCEPGSAPKLVKMVVTGPDGDELDELDSVYVVATDKARAWPKGGGEGIVWSNTSKPCPPKKFMLPRRFTKLREWEMDSQGSEYVRYLQRLADLIEDQAYEECLKKEEDMREGGEL